MGREAPFHLQTACSGTDCFPSPLLLGQKLCVCQGLHSDWDARIPRNSLLTTREAPLPDHSGCPSTTRSSSGSIVIATSMEIFVSTYIVCLTHIPVCSEHIPCSWRKQRDRGDVNFKISSLQQPSTTSARSSQAAAGPESCMCPQGSLKNLFC